MSHNTLQNYYKTLYVMTYIHKYSITDLENLAPFELSIYSDFIKESLKHRSG